MKTIKLIFSILLVGMVGLFFTQCSEDNVQPTVLYSISGTVTYPDFSGTATSAAGATVFLQVDGDGTSTIYDMSAVADASGNYTFANLLPGSYFVWATYNTNNTNASGRYDDIIFTGAGVVVEVVATDVTQAFALASAAETGTVSFDTNLYDGTTNPNETRFDGAHSSVVFGFPYKAGTDEFIGQFTGFDIGVKFDQANLSASAITATIDLTTVDTGQSGRDSKGKCIGSTFGIEYDPADTLADGSFDPAAIPLDGTDLATFTSRSIEKYGNGYLAKGDMVFNGNTATVNLFFTYEPGFSSTNSSNVTTEYSSFKGTMEFAALSAFGIDSSNIGDSAVTVYVSVQLRKTLP
ncbi:MAG: YceI family protein [Cyclobacteriaceae bacterium]|nr:YceI family protein [Cyclobacteriaceae bacterium]